MKILTITPNLQPDCDPEDLEPKTCARCGHSEVVHELIAYWYDGACEACDCTAFALFIAEEEGD